MKLIKPNKKYEKSFLAAVEEIRRQGDKRGSFHFNLDINKKNFNQYLRKWREEARGINLGRGQVPSTKFWLIDRGQFIGQLRVRHRLNARLRKISGHIASWVRPSKRLQGYGTAILRLGLQEAKKLGIRNVLLICNKDNFGARKTITANGGVFKNQVIYKKEVPKMRYFCKI